MANHRFEKNLCYAAASQRPLKQAVMHNKNEKTTRMDQNKKIEFIIQLRNSALTMWGYLITVSLGITAYIGSQVKNIEPTPGLVLIFLYALFAFSNANALITNFKSRIIISDISKKDKDDEYVSEFLKLNSFNNKTIVVNMIFHVIIDSCVITMLFTKIEW